jgi:hypothetical protein
MKKLSLALFALAMALATVPEAQADSFYYKIDGVNFSADLTFTTGDAPVIVPGPNSSNVTAYIVTSVAGIFDIVNGPSETFGATPTESANSGANAYNPTTSSDGQFLFDNLLYPENAHTGTGSGILDAGGILFKFDGGYELNLFSGSFGEGAPSDPNAFYFADNGVYHSNNNPILTDGNAPAPDDLTSAPEPGSLFLFGSGLLCLALVLYRRNVKRPSQPVANF